MCKRKPRITAIWTRELTAVSTNGRMGILKNIQAVLQKDGTLTEIRQASVIERLGTVRGGLVMLSILILNYLLGRPLPLQCALFSAPRKIAREVIATAPDVVVLDSIRQISLLRHLRRESPNLPIILDMDDLMSRRFALLMENGFLPSLGEFRKKLPDFFAKLLTSPTISNLIMAYERKSLERAEVAALNLATKVVMVSQKEAKILRDRHVREAKEPDATRLNNISAIAPPVTIPERFTPFDPKGREIRFAFIGSDSVVQNATAIDELLSIWSKERPSQDLVLFGNLTRTYISLPPNVKLYGFVDSISTVYDGRTVLLAPTRLGGGVKTKFLEAFAHGAPVVGSKLTYEGVADAPAYQKLEDLKGTEELFDEDQIVPLLVDAARQGREIVESQYSSNVYRSKWSALFFDIHAKTT